MEALMSTIAYGSTRTRSVRPAPVRHLHAVPAPSSARPVRLTRRGKAVVLGFAVAAIAMLAVVLGSSTVATGEAGTAPDTNTVTVMAGHTLWDIAAEANPNGDIRDTVDEIVRLNSLPNASALQMGSEIAVPVYE
jgi:Tfp pilus assembly protein FimV